MILAFTRGIRHSIFEQQAHRYSMWEVRAPLVELTGSTMGIIGYGAFGRALAKRASAFDMPLWPSISSPTIRVSLPTSCGVWTNWTNCWPSPIMWSSPCPTRRRPTA